MVMLGFTPKRCLSATVSHSAHRSIERRSDATSQPTFCSEIRQGHIKNQPRVAFIHINRLLIANQRITLVDYPPKPRKDKSPPTQSH